MPEQAFESKFSQLVQNELSQKLPAALPYRVGFQLVERQDKPDGGEKAVGVTGLSLSDINVYIPAVFNKGELRGMDLMWIREADVFVPSDEEWLNSLKEVGGRMFPVGGTETRFDKMFPGKAPEDVTLINTAFLSTGKSAEVLPDPVKTSMFEVVYTPIVPLALLRKYSPIFCEKAAALFTEPDIANKILEKFGKDYLLDLLAVTSSTTDKEADQNTLPHSKVVVVTVDSPEARSLTTAEKKQMMKNQFYVRDERKPEETSQVFQNKRPASFQTPSHSGVWDLFTADGSLMRCMVVLGREDKKEDSRCERAWKVNRDTPSIKTKPAVVIPLEKTTKAYITDIDKLCGRKVDTLNKEDEVTIGHDPTVRRLQAMRKDSDVLVIQPHRWVRVERAWSEKDPPTRVFIHTDDNKRTDGTVQFSDTPGKIVSINKVLFIPSNARLVEVTHDQLPFVQWEQVQDQLFKEAGCKPMRIYKTSGGWQIQYNRKQHPVTDKLASLEKLVYDLRISGGLAQQILKEAERQSVVQYMLKESAVDVGPVRTSYTVRQPQEVAARANLAGVRSSADTVKNLTDAAEKGDSDVFELSALKELLKAADESELSNDVLDELTSAMDACGRQLFAFYWHSDEYETKYGAEDAKKLENKLLNDFRELGKTVIMLKQKDINKK